MLIFTERRNCLQFGNAVGTCPWCRGVGKRDFGIKLFLGLPRGRVATPHSPSPEPAPSAIPEIIWEAGDFFFSPDALSGLCVPTAFQELLPQTELGRRIFLSKQLPRNDRIPPFQNPRGFQDSSARRGFPCSVNPGKNPGGFCLLQIIPGCFQSKIKKSGSFQLLSPTHPSTVKLLWSCSSCTFFFFFQFRWGFFGGILAGKLMESEFLEL